MFILDLIRQGRGIRENPAAQHSPVANQAFCPKSLEIQPQVTEKVRQQRDSCIKMA
jgi:hypothetical protein